MEDMKGTSLVLSGAGVVCISVVCISVVCISVVCISADQR